MTRKPILTAIILTFNHENIIERCIKSIVEQKTSYPYEVHIYDDCSKDNNAQICQKYAELYPEKVKFFPQKENTFLKPYKQTQAYKAMQGIDTKYFCIIEGDDYWCDDNKLQIALDFLEKNPEYVGFAHDTLQVNEFDGTERSWVHDLAKYEIKNPITFSDNFIFLMTSSRVFRNCGFKNVDIWPVDYLVYNYHLEKGPIYYYDKIMSVYTYGQGGTFATLGKKIKDMNGMFAYKVSCLLDFKHDDICTTMQKWYDTNAGSGIKHYNRLLKFKKIFGIKLGWKLWFIHRFVFKYGFESMDLNYVYPRKEIKKQSNERFSKDLKKQEVLIDELKNLEVKSELYYKDKSNGLNKENFFSLLKESMLFCNANSCLVELKLLEEKYPETKEIAIALYKSEISRLTQKNIKHKRQRSFYMTTTVLLLLLNLVFIFCWNLGFIK